VKKHKLLIYTMVALVGVFAICFALVSETFNEAKYKQQSITEFTNILNTDKISHIEYIYDYEKDRLLRYSIDGTKYVTKYPSMYFSFNTDVYKKLAEHNIRLETKTSFASQVTSVMTYLPSVFMILIMLLLFKSMSHMFTEDIKVAQADEEKTTLKDVAGYPYVKDELQSVVHMLTHPQEYERYSVRPPKGVLLYGPPGNGKTLCARAVAGESDIPFFHISAAQIEDKFVGSGSKRLNKVLKEVKKGAKDKGKAILFIDEIDAIGSKREKRTVVELNQTLNTLLTAMDGFEVEDQVLFIAATNLLESLDPALTRSGRFDKHIYMPNPNKEDRNSIVTMYLNKWKDVFEDEVLHPVYVEELARLTGGKSSADIERIIEDSKVIAHKDLKEKVDIVSLRESMIRHVAGLKRNEALSDSDLKLVAYHEAGHTAVQVLVDKLGAESVAYVTVTPYGQSLGHMASSTNDNLLARRSDIKNKVRVLLAGRIVEELLTDGDYTVGAAGDIQEANRLLHAYVGKYGMSDNLPNLFVDQINEYNALIQEEVKNLRESLYAETKDLINMHYDVVEAIASELLKEKYISRDKLTEMLVHTSYNKKEAVSV